MVLYPTISGIVYAFTDWTGLGGNINFNGLDNFKEIFQTPETFGAVWHTVVMAVAITVIQNAIGLLLAMGVNAKIKTKGLLRTLLFAPMVMAPIIVGYIWQYIFVPNGAFSKLSSLIGLGAIGDNVLGKSSTAMWGIILIVIWQYSGYSMVIFLAGMQNVPEEINEAAALDGASGFKKFWWVTWPLIRTSLAINVTLSLIMGFKLFDQVISTTQGGPGYSTQTLSNEIYNQAFMFNRYGYGIALALIVFVLIAVVSYVQMHFLREKD